MATHMQKLVKSLTASPRWHIQTVYLGKKFVEDIFIRFLEIIDKDERLKRGKIKNPNSLISIAIRKLIVGYVEDMTSEVIQGNLNKKVPDNSNTNNNTVDNNDNGGVNNGETNNNPNQ